MARGFINLWAYLMVDGVEEAPVWLAGFGCGPSASRRQFRATAELMKSEWQVAANKALAGTRCTTPDGRVWVLTRFVVNVSRGSAAGP